MKVLVILSLFFLTGCEITVRTCYNCEDKGDSVHKVWEDCVKMTGGSNTDNTKYAADKCEQYAKSLYCKRCKP